MKNILRFFLNYLPDTCFLKLMYFYHFRNKLRLKSPKTFNEKLQWLKLYDRRPEYTIYADKYAVREHIANTIGEEYLIPLLGVWDKVEDVPWNKLPNQFVLKCNHGSAMNIICTDKSKFDIDEAKIKLKKWL
ncbi:MAG: ATP-grasp fold amidoligase family protein, partial [Paludibacter sp.]|nr:ATP-grasp fold amidoligase family protein [Paludibacter sp.]